MKRHKKRKRAKKSLKVNLRSSVRVKHAQWCKWAVDQIDGRTREGKWARGMRQESLLDLGHEPTIEERTWIDNFIIDQLKKRLYDMGIIRGEPFGSRDMGQAISESVNRRIMKKMGIKKPEKPLDINELHKKRQSQR